MKIISIVTFLLLCSLYHAEAQSSNKKTDNYRVWISLLNEPYHVQGTLYRLKETSLFVSDYVMPIEYADYDNPIREVMVSNIDLIEVRKKNRVGKIAIIGAVGGFAIGSIIGLAKGGDSNYSVEQKALLGGISLAIPGALVGMLVGSVKIVIPVEGKLFNYKKHKQQLQTYSTK
jgi:hypothetical protein